MTSRQSDVKRHEFSPLDLFCHEASDSNDILRLLFIYIFSYNLVDLNCVKRLYAYVE